MAELHVENIDGAVLDVLRCRAAAHRRSVEEEVRTILVDAIAAPVEPLSISDFIQRTEGIRRRTACCPQTDSAILVREDRER
jgi:plasmid stability protein